MADLNLEIKSFIERHPDIKSIDVSYCDNSYIDVTINIVDKNTGEIIKRRAPIYYKSLSHFSKNGNYEFMYFLSMIYELSQIPLGAPISRSWNE